MTSHPMVFYSATATDTTSDALIAAVVAVLVLPYLGRRGAVQAFQSVD
jgi:hypothetical protein